MPDGDDELLALRAFHTRTMNLLQRVFTESDEARTRATKTLAEGGDFDLANAIDKILDLVSLQRSEIDFLHGERDRVIHRLQGTGDHYAAAIVAGEV